MPVFTVTAKSSRATIFDSICNRIIKDVAETIEVNPDTLTVLYRGLDKVKTDNKTNVNIAETENIPTTNSKRRFVVNVETEYDEDNLDTMATHQDEYDPIFYDKVTELKISPVYMQIKVKLMFEYISPTGDVNSMRDKIRFALSRTRNIGHHDVTYTVLIPRELEEVIGDVYDLRNRLIPQDLSAYFIEHSDNRIHLITDMSNESNAMLGINETQTRIVGVYDFSPFPNEIERDKEKNTNKFSFDYSFTVSIPRFFRIYYPVVVCNKLMPDNYLSVLNESFSNRRFDKKRNLRHIGKSYQAWSNLESNRALELERNLDIPINIPVFDYLNPNAVHSGYGLYMSLLCLVDEGDKKTLFNLKDLGDYKLTDTLIKLLKEEERFYITKPYNSYLYLGLHQSKIHFDNPILEVDEDLNVRSKVELSLLKPVRVSLSVCLDMSFLREEVVNRLIGNRELSEDFLVNYLEFVIRYPERWKNPVTIINTFTRLVSRLLDRCKKVDDLVGIRNIFTIVKGSNTNMLSHVVKYLVEHQSTLSSYIINKGYSFLKYSNDRYDIVLPKVEGYYVLTGKEDLQVPVDGDYTYPDTINIPNDRGLLRWQ